MLCFDLGIEPLRSGPERSETPATSKKRGSFNWDRANGWTLEWGSFAEFEAWLRDKQLAKSIEFVLSSTKTGNWLWSGKWTYVCSHQITGGQKKYDKKYPDWQRKINCYAPLLIFGARATYLLLVSSDYRLCVLPAHFSALPDFSQT